MCNLETPADEPMPMMRAPLNESATSWTKRPLTSEEGADSMQVYFDFLDVEVRPQ